MPHVELATAGPAPEEVVPFEELAAAEELTALRVWHLMQSSQTLSQPARRLYFSRSAKLPRS